MPLQLIIVHCSGPLSMLLEMELMPAKWAVIPFIFIQMVSVSALYFIVPQLVIFKVCYSKFNSTVCSHLGLHQFRAEETLVFNEAAAWNAVIHFAALCPNNTGNDFT